MCLGFGVEMLCRAQQEGSVLFMQCFVADSRVSVLVAANEAPHAFVAGSNHKPGCRYGQVRVEMPRKVSPDKAQRKQT